VTDLERHGTGAAATRSGARKRRWPALIGGLVLAAVKSEALLRLIVHRGSLIVVVAVLLGGSLLRTRPVGTAAGSALLLALVLGAHSVGLGLSVGFGVFALLITLFFAISAVLHARQNRATALPRRMR
jgi:hypothetical protein